MTPVLRRVKAGRSAGSMSVSSIAPFGRTSSEPISFSSSKPLKGHETRVATAGDHSKRREIQERYKDGAGMVPGWCREEEMETPHAPEACGDARLCVGCGACGRHPSGRGARGTLSLHCAGYGPRRLRVVHERRGCREAAEDARAPRGSVGDMDSFRVNGRVDGPTASHIRGFRFKSTQRNATQRNATQQNKTKQKEWGNINQITSVGVR